MASGVPRFEAGRQVGPVEPTVNILPVGAAACTDLAEMRADSGTTKTVDTVGQWTGTGCFKLGTTGEALGGYLSDAGYPILPATRYSASAAVKGAGNLTITFKTYPSNGTVTTTIELTDKFQRVECPNLLTGTSDTIVRFIFRYTTGTGTFWIDGAQIEQKDHCTPWTESKRVGDQSVMIEEGTTNYVVYSAVDSSWVEVSSNGAFSTPAYVATDGAVVLPFLADTSALTHRLLSDQFTGPSATTVVTTSVHLYIPSDSDVQCIWLRVRSSIGSGAGGAFVVSGGTVTSTLNINPFGTSPPADPIAVRAENLGAGCYRLSVTCTTSSDAEAYTRSMDIGISCTSVEAVAGTANTKAYFWNAQVEAKPYPTGYMPTGAAQATRNNEILTVPTAGILNNTAGTIECWAKAPRRADLNYQTIFAIWPFFYVGIKDTNSRVRLHVYDGGVTRSHDSSYDIDTNQWHHYAATWDTEYIWLYVDGVLAVTASLATYIVGTIPADLTVGARSSNTYYWNGLIDDLRIYQEALTADQVARRFAGAEI